MNKDKRMGRRIFALIIVFALMLSGTPLIIAQGNQIQLQFYVEVSGNDSNSGAVNAPFRTVERAIEEVRKYNQNMTGDIIVNIGAGRYELQKEIRIRSEDSGNGEFDVIYRGTAGEMPQLSGAKQITGWQKGENGLWTVAVPNLKIARELYVNGVPAVRARSEKKVTGTANYLSPNSYYSVSDGFYALKSDIGLYKNSDDIQLHWPVYWKDYYIKVESITQDPNNTEQVIVRLDNAVWDSITAAPPHPDGLVPRFNVGFIVENAYELLDEPGEFYYNKKTMVLSYLPREGENMDDAEVLCPQLDRLLRIDGRDFDHKVSNVRFESIEFAHTTSNAMEYSSYANQQGEIPIMPSMPGNSTPASVEVNWAENIDINSCKFFGTNYAGLSFADGVLNSTAIGNIFTDMGSAAFILGKSYHNKVRPPDDVNAPANVMFRKSWRASYTYSSYMGGTIRFINSDTGEEFNIFSNENWYNEPWAAERGIKSWILADLEDEYTIDKIRLYFATDNKGNTIDQTQKSNFEVLASNDPEFKSYARIANYGQNTNQLITTGGTGSNKYRYVMIRKTVAEPFAITALEVYSYDRQPLGEQGLCKNIDFSNNYIARTGAIHTQAPAVIAYYSDNAKIWHNEIYQASYTGISLGWGWELINTTAQNNSVKYNKIDGCMLQSYDGGGIYTLGNLPGTEISENYIANQESWYAGIYFDTGTAFIRADNNVVQNVPTAIYSDSSNTGIVMTNTWADTNFTDIAGDVEIHNPNLFTIDKPPNQVLSIMSNAGLEPSYEHIREGALKLKTPGLRGPDVVENFCRVAGLYASNRARLYIHTANVLLDNAAFGNLPWQFDPEFKQKISHYSGRLESVTNRTDDRTGGHILEEYMLKECIDRAYESVVHMEAAEMLDFCENKLSSLVVGNEIGQYSQNAVDTFSGMLGDVKEMPVGTEYEKSLVVKYLEEAYTELENERHSADITSFFVLDGETVIDNTNRIVTVKVPLETIRTGAVLSPVVELTSGTVCPTDFSAANYGTPLSVTITNTVIGKSADWTINIVYENAGITAKNIILEQASGWNNKNKNTVLPLNDGVITFQPWFDAYMQREAIFEGHINFGVVLDRADSIQGVNFLLSARSADIEVNGRRAKNTYYMLSIKGGLIELSSVVGSTASVQKTLVARSNSSGFSYGKLNVFDVEITAGTPDKIKVLLNGGQIINADSNSGIGAVGFFGIYSPDVKLKLNTLSNTEYFEPLKAGYKGKIINVTTGGVSLSNESYKIITAFFAGDNTLLGVDIQEIGQPESGVYTEISVNIDTGNIPGAENAAYVKAMMLDSFDNIRPIAKQAIVSRAVEIAQGKFTGGSNVLMSNPVSNMTDGNEESYAMIFGNAETNGKGHLYIDLGYKYKIAYIEILAYNSVAYTRCGDFDICLSNEVPDVNPPNATNGKMLITRTPIDENASSADIGYKTYYIPPEIAGAAYRYVSLEKLFDNISGLVIQELKVYVLSEDMPMVTEVAHGKSVTGVHISGSGNQASETIGRVNDGDETSYFWLYNESGFGYIDLGVAQRIAYIEVMSYSLASYNRTGGYDICLSNKAPAAAPPDGVNKVLVAHTPADKRFYIDYTQYPGEIVQQISAANADGVALGYRTFGIPNEIADTPFRYVSLEKLQNEIGLQIQEIKVYVLDDDIVKASVEVASGASGGGSNLANPASMMTDGYENTYAWIFENSGHVYLDLKTAYKIAYIEILAYNGIDVRRAGDFDICLSNEIPAASTGASDKVRVVRVPLDSNATSAAVGYKTFIVPAGIADAPYRYISLEKFHSTVGLVVQELKVYVNEDDIPKI